VLIPEITAKRFRIAKPNFRHRTESLIKVYFPPPVRGFRFPGHPALLQSRAAAANAWTAQTLICFCVAGHTPTGMSAATVINHRRFSEEPKSG